MAHAAPVGFQVILRDRQVPVTGEGGRHGRKHKANERKAQSARDDSFCGEPIFSYYDNQGGEAITAGGGLRANRRAVNGAPSQEHREGFRFYAKRRAKSAAESSSDKVQIVHRYHNEAEKKRKRSHDRGVQKKKTKGRNGSQPCR